MKKTVFLLFLLLPFCYLLAQPPVPVNHPFTSIAQPEHDKNYATNEVDGDDNFWIDVQVGNDNYLWLDITGNKNGEGDKSESYQEGNRNYADVHQPGNRNRFDIFQKNKIGLGTDNRNKTYINQIGNRNEAIVDQRIKVIPGETNTDGKLVAKSWQKGNRNLSKQEQKGMYNRAFAVQKGDRGVAEQYQGGANSVDPTNKAYYSSAVIKQRKGAVRAKAYQYQNGFNNDALVLQNTDRSKAYQVQFNDADAEDDSWNDNVARIKQKNDALGFGERNRAYQVQAYEAGLGDVGNMATIKQKGSHNVAWQVQLGAKNEAIINQKGDNNHGKIIQLQTGNSGLPVAIGALPFSVPGAIQAELLP